MNSLHDFSSWLSIKPLYQTFLSNLFMKPFYQTFLPNLSIKPLYQTVFMISHHSFLSNLSIKRSSCFLFMTFYQTFLPNNLHVFSLWLSIKCKKVMQKTGKISIFNSLDIKLEFLTSQVELIWFLVESSCVKLKICSIQLESSWKCEQSDFESSRIQNFNPKLDSTISLCLWKKSSSARSWSYFCYKL